MTIRFDQKTAEEYGAPQDYVLGANIGGLVRVAEAMRALSVSELDVARRGVPRRTRQRLYAGVTYGRSEGAADLRKELVRESTLRQSAERKVSSLESELAEAQSRLTLMKQELAQITRRFELFRQS